MSLVDLRAFGLPGVTVPSPLDAVDGQSAMLLSEADQPLSDEEVREVQAILREVAAVLAKTPGALGSMRRRLGIIVDCLIAVADQFDGDADLEETCEDEGAQCDDEGQPEDNGLADMDGEAEQWGSMHRQGGWVTG